MRYDEITASNLLEIDLDGNIINGEGEINETGYVIHGAIHKNRKDIHKNLDRACKLIDFGVGYFWERPVRLVVLPEYFLQGVTTPGKGEAGLDDFMDKAITIPGPEIEVLSEKAREYNLFISGGGVIELLSEFPDRWFNTAFIIGPSGDLILKYHKWHIPASIGMGTSPHDMLDDYTKVFGKDIRQRFPVVDTEIGKLGVMTCHDGATPEVSRALGFNGDEVICHPTAMQEVEELVSLGIFGLSPVVLVLMTTCATSLAPTGVQLNTNITPRGFAQGTL